MQGTLHPVSSFSRDGGSARNTQWGVRLVAAKSSGTPPCALISGVQGGFSKAQSKATQHGWFSSTLF
jgi:hypothetical protein